LGRFPPFTVLNFRSDRPPSCPASQSAARRRAAAFVAPTHLFAGVIRHLGLARCAGLSAAAGVLRWSVMGTTIWMPALVGVPCISGGLRRAVFSFQVADAFGVAVRFDSVDWSLLSNKAIRWRSSSWSSRVQTSPASSPIAASVARSSWLRSVPAACAP